MKAALAIVGLCLAGPPATAQDVAPTPDALRAAFETRMADAPPVPPLARDALVAALDRTFPARPAARSVVTLALAHTLLSDVNRTDRAVTRATVAALASALTPAEIVDWVTSTIHLGRGCFGVEAASPAFFGIAADRMDAGQAALLAAIHPALAVLEPGTAPDRARARRDRVLGEMVRTGALTGAEAEAARARPVIVRPADEGRCD